MLAISAGGVFGSTIPRRSTSRCIVSRGSISTRPRLPMIATRPAFRENRQIFPEIHVREQFHDHVNTAPAGRLHDLLEMVRRTMIEHFVRALFAGELASFVTAGGAEHAQTASTRNCTAAVPTPPLAPCTSTVSPGSASARWNNPRYAVAYGRAHGRALRERNIFRQAMHLRRFAQGKLGICCRPTILAV